MIRRTFEKYYFYTLSHIRHCTSFVYVIPLIFSSFITIAVLSTQKYLFQNEDDNWSCPTWPNKQSENIIFSCTMSWFQHMTSWRTSFCSKTAKWYHKRRHVSKMGHDINQTFFSKFFSGHFEHLQPLSLLQRNNIEKLTVIWW